MTTEANAGANTGRHAAHTGFFGGKCFRGSLAVFAKNRRTRLYTQACLPGYQQQPVLYTLKRKTCMEGHVCVCVCVKVQHTRGN